MSPRRLFRVVLSVAILILLWTRVSREWHARSSLWLIGGITLSAVLLLVLFAELTGLRKKRTKPADEVPKHPLGLDS